jgi:hypothetical protein
VTAQEPPERPVAHTNAFALAMTWRSSSIVRSGVASIAVRIAGPWASVCLERRSPPTAFGLASPCARSSARHRLTLAALTPKRAAAPRPEAPCATALKTRLRRSKERDWAISAGPQPGQKLESLQCRFGNPPTDSISSDAALIKPGACARSSRSTGEVSPRGQKEREIAQALLDPLRGLESRENPLGEKFERRSCRGR